MRLQKTLFIIAIMLCLPYMTMAFSWGNLLNWVKPQPKIQIENQIKIEKPILTPEQKYQNWVYTYNNNNFTNLIKNQENFILTEAEANYILSLELAKTKNPPIKDAKLYFLDGEIELHAYLLEPWQGDVILRIKPILNNNKIEIDVTKARFRKFYFPKSVAENLLNKNLDETLNFLYQYPDYTDLQILIDNNNLQLLYK